MTSTEAAASLLEAQGWVTVQSGNAYKWQAFTASKSFFEKLVISSGNS